MENQKHPIEDLMITAMTSIESMVDVNTVIGDAVVSQDGTTIIPISKVCFGFASGGSEFNSNKLAKYSENAKLPFGGGSGAAVNINPVGFLVIKDSSVKMITVDSTGPIDKLVDIVPDVVNKMTDIIKKSCEKPKEVLKIKEEKQAT